MVGDPCYCARHCSGTVSILRTGPAVIGSAVVRVAEMSNLTPPLCARLSRTSDRLVTRSAALRTERASCTDGTGYRTDGARRAGIIWSAGPRTGPRVAARRYP